MWLLATELSRQDSITSMVYRSSVAYLVDVTGREVDLHRQNAHIYCITATCGLVGFSNPSHTPFSNRTY
jgi:hypothetical protein